MSGNANECKPLGGGRDEDEGEGAGAEGCNSVGIMYSVWTTTVEVVVTTAALVVGPHSCCSPRHLLAFGIHVS